jgi:cephalosporin hydroxylase
MEDPVAVDPQDGVGVAFADDVAVDGVAVDGVAVDGVAVDGVAVDGVAVDGVTVEAAGAGADVTDAAQGLVAEAVTVQATVDAFHRLYYAQLERTWTQTYWMGTVVLKCPLDLWIYQEILHEVRPDLVVEAGTYKGGSALFLAGICDLVGHGEVVTIDVDSLPDRPFHPRLHYLTGSSVAPEILREVADRARAKSVLVILDSDHSYAHVLEELRCYRQVVTPGSYLIVEDTCINGHPLLPDFGPGPMEAVAEFLREAPEYSVDTSREKLYLTFNPCGFLRRALV